MYCNRSKNDVVIVLQNRMTNGHDSVIICEFSSVNGNETS